MKAAELTVGLAVAVTEGTGRYERETTKATKCEIVGEPRSGKVQVKLLEDARSPIGARGIGSWQRENWKKAGDLVSVKTSWVWMPWENLETRAENERRNAEQKQREEDAREERLAELQRRTDQFAGEVDEALAWAGYKSLRSGVDTHVRIPTEALEALLDKAEG